MSNQLIPVLMWTGRSCLYLCGKRACSCTLIVVTNTLIIIMSVLMWDWKGSCQYLCRKKACVSVDVGGGLLRVLTLELMEKELRKFDQ